MNRRSYVKEIASIVCIIAAFGIFSYSLFGPGGYRALQKAQMEMHERQARVHELETDVERRAKNANAIDEDALGSGHPESLELLERKAREQGYAREGEFIQRLSD